MDTPLIWHALHTLPHLQGLPGRALNFVSLKRAISALDRWYHDSGVLGQVGLGPGAAGQGWPGPGALLHFYRLCAAAGEAGWWCGRLIWGCPICGAL